MSPAPICAKRFAPGGSGPVCPNSMEFVNLPPEFSAVSFPNTPATLQLEELSKQVPLAFPEGVSTRNSCPALAGCDRTAVKPAISVIGSTKLCFLFTHFSLNTVQETPDSHHQR